jgi:hypothetical protein
LNKLLNDITTGADNSTHEIVRVLMLVVMVIMVIAFIIGSVMEIRHAVMTGQWDLQAYFQAILTFVLGIGAFLLSGAGSIKLKQGKEPSGPPISSQPQGATP